MKNNLLFLGSIIVFHHLFWQQTLGLNIVLFTLGAASFHYIQNGIKTWDKLELFLGACFLISMSSVVIVNSALSQFMCCLTFIGFLGHLKLRKTSFLESFVNGLIGFVGNRGSVLPSPVWTSAQRRPVGVLYTRLAIIPILIFAFYMLMFSGGNAIFKEWNVSVFGQFFDFLHEISWLYVLFMALGVFISAWVFRAKIRTILSINSEDQLFRIRKRRKHGYGNNGLKHEYIMAIMLFGLLNALFGVVNFIDVKWVWFQFDLASNFSLKDFVHSGVGYLIATLLLSMGLILFFFRKNLNFYPNSKLLKTLAYAWVIQNGILAISVVLRTTHYINFHGLASGRIALMFFLTMVFFGLATLFIKIATKRNYAYLLRINSAFGLLLLSAAALVNWDGMIAKVNLNHAVANEIDVNNYLDLNPQVYPYLFENLDKIERQIRYHNNNEIRWITYTNIEDFEEALLFRSRNYLEQRSKLSAFDSWTWPDQKAVGQLEGILASRDRS